MWKLKDNEVYYLVRVTMGQCSLLTITKDFNKLCNIAYEITGGVMTDDDSESEYTFTLEELKENPSIIETGCSYQHHNGGETFTIGKSEIG